MKNEQSQSVEISVEQAKLLGSAKRIKIIGALDRQIVELLDYWITGW